MLEFISSITNSNIPIIFVIVGIMLLFLALGVELTSKIETTKVKPKQAGALGTVFLILGLVSFALPSIMTPSGIEYKKETESKFINNKINPSAEESIKQKTINEHKNKSTTKKAIPNDDIFFIDSIASIDYSNGKATFKEYGFLWSKKPVINFKHKETYSIMFEIQPSFDALEDSKGNIWQAKPDLFLSTTNDFNKFSNVKEYVKRMKDPLFIDLDTKDNGIIQIQLLTVNKGIIRLGEAKKYSKEIYTQGKWHPVKVDINLKTGNIIIWINDEKIVEVEKTKQKEVKQYFSNNPELYMALASWSSADFSIKDISIE